MLFGRRDERELLERVLAEVRAGASRLLWLYGPSGIGKSSLVESLREQSLLGRDAFASGSNEPLHSHSPYHPWCQALRSLLRQMLSQETPRVDQWRQQLQRSVDQNSGLLATLLPELAHFLDAVQDFPILSPEEARNHAQSAFFDLLQGVLEPGRALVLFLDDMQWADAASLELLEYLASSTDWPGLLLVVGYREEEVEPSHPLRKLQAQHEADHPDSWVRLPLGPLEGSEITALLEERYGIASQGSSELSGLLERKTGGNPFFLRAFIEHLQRQGLLSEDLERWDLESIQEAEATDNVIELMLKRLRGLEGESQEALKLLACFGRECLSSNLAQVMESPEPALGQMLELPKALGLIEEATPGHLRFAHDRIQEAAYSLCGEAERPGLHLAVGRVLLGREEEAKSAEGLFGIVEQLKRGLGEMDPGERHDFAQLALVAGQRARKAAAFGDAFGFFEAGLEALGSQRWERHYGLTLSLSNGAADAALLSAEEQVMKARIQEIIAHTHRLEDQIPAYVTRVRGLVLHRYMREALEEAEQFWAKAGVRAPQSSHPLALMWEALRTLFALRGRGPQELLKLPEAKGALVLGDLQMHYLTITPYITTRPALVPITILRYIRSVLRYGVTGEGANVWTGYGLLLCMLGKVEAGARYARLALEQIELLQRPDIWPNAALLSHLAVYSWSRPLASLVEPTREIAGRAREVGDRNAEMASRHLALAFEYYAGIPLEALYQQLEKESRYYERALKSGHGEYPTFLRVVRLLQRSAAPSGPPRLQASDASSTHDPNKNLQLELLRTTIEVQLNLLFGEMEAAFAVAMREISSLQSPLALGVTAPLLTYALIALCHGWRHEWAPRRKIQKRIRRYQRLLARWVGYYPPTRRYRLTWAQAARLQGRSVERALEYYVVAWEQAVEAEIPQDAALIAEQTAALFERCERPKEALAYVARACEDYQRWGATTKLVELRQRYPQLQPADASRPAKGDSLEALLETCHQLFYGRPAQDLARQLLALALQRSGAELGRVFLREHSEGWALSLLGASSDPDAFELNPRIDEDTTPASLLRFVALTQEIVLLERACHEGAFAKEPYIRRKQSGSILCIPMVEQRQLLGLLYLEDPRQGAFSPSTREALETIVDQAALALAYQRLGGGLPGLDTQYRTPSQRATASRRHLQHQLKLGLKVGPWELVKLLGEGGMATVYEAHHTQLPRRAALKLLASGLHPEPRLRLHAEARLLQLLQHPHIVECYEAGKDPTHGDYLCLELLSGETLSQRLAQEQPSIPWMLAITKQLCDALCAVHEAGVIHRDLKPSNVFLLPHQPFPLLKLIDFGIAKSQDSQLTQTGSILGTPAYMAPEQLREDGLISPATDIYALSVMWFEALTGELPYQAETSVELYVQILQEPPLLLGALRPTMSASQLEALLQRSLSKDPAARHSSASAWLEALEEACRHTPTESA